MLNNHRFAKAALFLATALTLSPAKAQYHYDLPQSIAYTQQEFGEKTAHILKVDPKRIAITLQMSDQDKPARTTSQLCAQHKALAAINGGFFDYNSHNKLHEAALKLLAFLGYTKYHTKPVFALKKDGRWHSHSSILTGAIGWQHDGEAAIIGAIKTTPTQDGVLITDGDNQTVTDRWNKMDSVLAGTPLLLQNGQIVKYTQTRTSPFYTNNYSRTAVGIMPDGTWLMLVINNCPIAALAQIMHELGCANALNLDGGHSTTMVIDNKVVNDLASGEHTLFEHERPISNCITLKSR